MSVRVRRIPPVTEQELAAAEAELGVEIPETYRRFLTVTNGGQPVEAYFSTLVGVQKFLGLRDLVSTYATLRGRIPAHMLPIALAEGGNLVVVATSDERGAVYFWDHELEHVDSPLQKLASSFDNFAGALKPRSLSPLPDPQVAKVTVKNPELFRELLRRDKEAQTAATVEWPPSS